MQAILLSQATEGFMTTSYRSDALDDVPQGTVLPKRSAKLAVKRGLRKRCPACGEGRILDGYLKSHRACPACGEELHHHRADDFPQYITIFVVAHILVAALLVVDDIWPDLPMAFHYAVWPLLVVVLCLWLLPVFKSMLIAYQWALRMHGFETAHRAPVPADEVEADEERVVRTAA